jgi:hypothetical protein
LGVETGRRARQKREVRSEVAIVTSMIGASPVTTSDSVTAPIVRVTDVEVVLPVSSRRLDSVNF